MPLINPAIQEQPEQPGQAQQGNDEYSTPIPQGAQTGPAASSPGSDEYSTPIPQNAMVGDQPQDGMLQAEQVAGKHLKDIATNAFHAAGQTALGLTDMVRKIPGAKALDRAVGITDQHYQQMHDIADSSVGNGFDKAVGYGGETLLEFLMGDEVLKGMSFADKLSKSAQIAKWLENSPRAMNALKMGANITKAQGTLGPDELALVKKYPILARLVGAGMDAVRQGVVQFGQGTARGTEQTGSVTEGLKQGAVEGGEMALGSAVVGAPLAVAGGVLEKGAEGAATVKKMAGVAKTAPTQEAITDMAQDATKQAEEQMHAHYEAGAGELSTLLDNQPLSYENSPLHQTVQELIDEGQNAKHPLDEALSVGRPGSSKVNNMLDKLADPWKKEAEEAGGEADDIGTLFDPYGQPIQPQGAAPEAKQPIMLDTDKLLEMRQRFGQRLRKLGWMTAEDRADRDIYGRLIEGVDKSLNEMAQVSANPEAMQKLTEMNSKYRQTKALLGNKDVQALVRGNVGDVGARLARGETAADDIDAVRKLLLRADEGAGQPAGTAFGKLSDNIFQRWVADASPEGRFDPEKLLKKWNGVKPEVRDQLFAPRRAALKQVMGEVGDAASVKKLIKYGVLPAVAAGAGSTVHGPVGALIGFLAGAGADGFGKVREFLDYIANHPATWRTLEAADRSAKSVPAQAASKLTKYAVGRNPAAAAYGAAAAAMSGDEDQPPQR